MAVADERKTKGAKLRVKSKKIGRPPQGGGIECSYPKCTNKAQTKGKCRTHSRGGKCSHSNCEKQAQFKGLCAGHGGKRVCSHTGCDKKVASKGKCGDHGGGRPSWHPERRRDRQKDATLMLASTAAQEIQGSLVSLLEQPMGLPFSGQTDIQIKESSASGIVSEVLL